MNDREHADLEALRRRHAQLQSDMATLANDFRAFEQRILLARLHESITHEPVVSPLATPAPEPVQVPPAVPPIIQPASFVPESWQPTESVQQGATEWRSATQEQTETGDEQRLAGTIAAPAEEQPVAAQVSVPSIPPPISAGPGAPSGSAGATRRPAPAARPSFEARIGTFWLVRIGIVMLLTGLVFFGNYAYQKYIGRIGPAGKVALLYFASFGLLGAGWVLQRKSPKETLRNYAQVVFAGGLAAVYFTTYAAHHFPHLEVIHSAVTDGLLLFAWAGFIAWIADRKKSELLALFAVLLAYYTGVISRDAGLFTLYSNLLLTITAVFFLVRNRWATLSFASLGATYAAYAFWRFLHGSEWSWAYPEEGLWTGVAFLASYWLVFTSAVFLSRDEKFAGANRAGFITANNGALFALFLLTMFQVHQGGFWKFATGYGAMLIVLAAVAKRILKEEPIASNTYLTQGLLLLTTGIVCHPKLAGLNLAVVLAVESVTLLATGYFRNSRILKGAAYIAALLGLGWGMDGMLQHESHGLWLAMLLGALMLADAILVHRKNPVAGARLIRPKVGFFVFLALAIWFVATWNNAERPNFSVILAAEGLLLTLSIYVLEMPELTLMAQGYLVIAHLVWAFDALGSNAIEMTWRAPAALAGITLALQHWWTRQKRIQISGQLAFFWPALYSAGVVAIGWLWLGQRLSPGAWIATAALLAVAMTAYAVITRSWMLALFCQGFLVASCAEFARQLFNAHPAWWLALMPIAATIVLSLATGYWLRRYTIARSISDPVTIVAKVYQWVAFAMSIWWVAHYVPEREVIWVYALCGVALFAIAGNQGSRQSLLFSAGFAIAWIGWFWSPSDDDTKVYLPNLLAMLALAGQHLAATKRRANYPVTQEALNATLLVTCATLWLFVSRAVLHFGTASYLTASWSVLALLLFACGILLSEKWYRWTGLAILAAAIGRVVIVDVWKLDVIYRVLSFMALGVVLLVLGFVYSKYQEKIREWF